MTRKTFTPEEAEKMMADAVRHLDSSPTTIREKMEIAGSREVGEWEERACVAEARVEELEHETVSNTELVGRCNELARKFYGMQGYQVGSNFKFYESTHPHERGCWNMAVAAYEHIDGTEVEDALDEVIDDQRREEKS